MVQIPWSGIAPAGALAQVTERHVAIAVIRGGRAVLLRGMRRVRAVRDGHPSGPLLGHPVFFPGFSFYSLFPAIVGF